MIRTLAFFFALIFVVSLWSSSVWAVSGDVVAKFPTPGNHPTGLAYDTTTKTLWLADRMLDKIYQIDPSDGSVISEFDSPDYQIEGLAMEGDKLWAMDVETKRAYLLNTKTGVAERTIKVYCTQPKGLAFDGKYLWTSGRKKQRLYKIDPSDGTTVETFRTPSQESHGMAFDGKYLWISDRLDDEIYMVNPSDARVIMTLKSPSKFPRGVAFGDGYIWNVDYQTDKIYKIKRYDNVKRIKFDPRRESLYMAHELINSGPGEIVSADIFLAIPEDMFCQKLLSKVKIVPEPVEIITTELGRKVARCHFKNIKAGEKVIAYLKVNAELYRTRSFIVPEKTGTLADIPEEIKEKYLGSASKYDINDPYIQKIARRVVGEEKNCYRIARKVYDYILDEIEYERVAGWDSASKVLRSGKGSCSEYAFSLIAMCRASGLPARFVGAAVVQYDDASTDYGVYHRWPQVYLPNYGWVTFDASSKKANTPIPAQQASAIGFRNNRFLITTISNRDTKELQWSYNSKAFWKTKGPTTVVEERVGEWEPLEVNEEPPVIIIGEEKM